MNKNKPDWVKEPKELDFQLINKPLKEFVLLTIKKLETDNSDNGNYNFILKMLITSSFQTYRTVCHLVKEGSEFAYQAHILTRSILDNVFNVFALVEKPFENTRWFELSGYRDFIEEYQLEKKNYGNDSLGKGILEEREKFIKAIEAFLKITEDEKKNPESLSYWLSPPQMLRKKIFSGDRKLFLEELDKWNYGQLSEWSHGQWGGLAMSLFASMPEEHWHQGKLESDAVFSAQVFLLIILSEIELTKKYGYHQKARYLWTLLGEYFLEAKEYYELRYKNSLQL